MKEHAKYGKAQATMHPMAFCFGPQIVVGFGLIIGGAFWLGLTLSAGKPLPIGSLALLVLGVLIVAYCFYSLTKCGIYVYDRAVVVKEAFKTTELEQEDIRAMFWSFPGASEYNARAPRKNNTTCEFIMKNGKKGCKVSDAFYKNMEPPLSKWQSDRHIAKDL